MAGESLRHGRAGPEVGSESDGDEHAHEEFLSVVVGAIMRASTGAALSNTSASDRVKPKRVGRPEGGVRPLLYRAGPSLLDGTDDTEPGGLWRRDQWPSRLSEPA